MRKRFILDCIIAVFLLGVQNWREVFGSVLHFVVLLRQELRTLIPLQAATPTATAKQGI